MKEDSYERHEQHLEKVIEVTVLSEQWLASSELVISAST